MNSEGKGSYVIVPPTWHDCSCYGKPGDLCSPSVSISIGCWHYTPFWQFWMFNYQKYLPRPLSMSCGCSELLIYKFFLMSIFESVFGYLLEWSSMAIDIGVRCFLGPLANYTSRKSQKRLLPLFSWWDTECCWSWRCTPYGYCHLTRVYLLYVICLEILLSMRLHFQPSFLLDKMVSQRMRTDFVTWAPSKVWWVLLWEDDREVQKPR